MINKCPVCESRIERIDFVRQEYSYKKCRECGTLFVASELSTKDIYEHYSSNYYEAQGTDSKQREGYDSYFSLQDSLNISFENKLKLISRRIGAGRLLDMGTAYGSFLKKASCQYECVGVEISRYAAKTARTINQAQMVVSNLEETPFKDSHFDVITMWDVIEHLRYPVIALREVNRLLRAGGFCFISTDDVNNWLVKLMGRKWWSIAPPLHLSHFSKKSIKMAVERAGGFEICEIIKDQRMYKLNEIVRHFGTSYRNNFLSSLGLLIEDSPIGQVSVSIKRPEQFILILRKNS